MRYTFMMICAAVLFCNQAFAAIPLKTSPAALPDHLLTENFVRLTVHDFERASGKKLGFTQRLFFKKLQKRLIKSGYQLGDTILKHYDTQRGKFKLDPLWLVLGILIGPFAVLFSYTIRNPNRNKHISALIGFGLFVIWFGWFFIF